VPVYYFSFSLSYHVQLLFFLASQVVTSAAKLFCVNTVSDKVVRHSLAYLLYLCKEWFAGRKSHTSEIWPQLNNPFKNADFQ